MTTRKIKVCDVMRSDVATLLADDTIVKALGLFEELRVGGAPVVDDTGKVVGVLTLSDVARTERIEGNRVATQRGAFEMSEVVGEEETDEVDPEEVFFLKTDYSVAALGPELVGDWMTRNVVSLRSDATLQEACERMVEAQIHRVFVIDDGRLCGVVSSFDVVRHVAGTQAASRAKARR